MPSVDTSGQRWGIRLARWLLVTFAALVALLGLLVAGLALVSGERLGAWVAERASEALVAPMEIGSLRVSLPLSFRAQHVVLRDAEGRVAVSLAEVTGRVSLRGLLRRAVVVKGLRLRGGVVNAVTEDGTLSLTTLARQADAADSAGAWELRIDDAHAELARLTWRVDDATTYALHDLELGLASLVKAQERTALAGVVLRHRDAVARADLEVLGDDAPTLHADVSVDLTGTLLSSFVPPDVWRRVEPLGELKGRVDVAQRRARIALWSQGLRAYGLPARLDARVELSGTRLTLEALRLDLGAGEVEASGTLNVGDGLQGALVGHDLSIEARDVPVGVVAARELGVAEVAPLVLGGRAALRSGTLQADELRVDGAGAQLRVKGTLSAQEKTPWELRVAAEVSHAERYLAPWLSGVAVARLSLSGALAGRFNDLRAAGVVSVEGLKRRGAPEVDVHLPFVFGEKTLSINDARVTSGRGAARLRGALTNLDLRAFDARRLRAEGEVLVDEVDLAVATRAARGKLSGRLNLRGTLRDYEVRGELAGTGLEVVEVPLSGARLVAHLTPGRLDVTSAQATLATGGTLDAHGVYLWDRQALSDVRLAARDVDVAPIVERLEPAREVRGVLDLDASLQGDLRQLRGRVEAQIVDASVMGYALGAVGVDARALDGRVEGSIGAVGKAGSVDLSGVIELARGYVDVVLVTEKLALGGVSDDLADAGGMTARVSASVAARGVLPYPEVVRGAVRLHDVAFAGDAVFGAVEMTVAPGAAPNTYEVVGDVFGEGQVHAEVATLPTLSVDARAELEALALHRLLPALARAAVQVAVTGSAEVSYRLGELPRGTLRLQRVAAEAAGRRIKNVAPATVTYDGATLRLDCLELVSGAGDTFVARGVLGEEVDASVSGRIDVGFIVPFVRALGSAEGTIGLDGRAYGSLAAPRFELQASVAEPVRARARALRSDIVLREGRVTLTNSKTATSAVEMDVAGAFDAGAFRLYGKATLEGLAPAQFDLRLSGQNIAARTKDILGEANGTLRLVGSPNDALLSGRVHIVRARYLRKFELRDFNFIAKRPPDVSPPLAVTYPWMSKVRLQVAASSDAAIDVRVDAGILSLDLTLSSDVHVGGVMSQPVLEGRVEASRGRIEFPEAGLDVTQAVVELRPAPSGDTATSLTVRAEGEVEARRSTDNAIPTYFVTLGMSGDLSELALDLSSEPPMSRLETLALLVTGQANPRNLADGNGGSGLDAALVFAGSQLTAPLSRFVEAQLEEALNVRLQLGAELTRGGVKLTASKDVSRRLRIEGSYSTSIGGVATTTTQARARFLVSDRLFLEGRTASVTGQTQDITSADNASRVELKWRLYGD